MKRKYLLALTLSMLAKAALALPAAEQDTPQVNVSRNTNGQTLAADGSDRTPQGRVG